MSATATGDRVLELGPLRVEIALAPLSIHVRRAGRRLLRALTVWACEGEVRDRFVQVTEGVIADERLGFPERAVAATIAATDERTTTIALTLNGGRRAELRLELAGPEHLVLELSAEGAPLRLAVEWDARAEERFAGLGARHALRVDHAGRSVQLGADRAYTGPDCPPDMRELGGIPQGDYAPAPFLQSSRGLCTVVRDLRQRHALRARRSDPRLDARRGRPAAPARPHGPDARRPPAPLRAPHRPARAAARVGLRLLEVARRLPAPGRRRGGRPRLSLARDPARRDRARLALGDAIQHVGAQPAPVPGLRGNGRPLARDRRAHRRVGHTVGQPRVARRPDPARPRLRAGCTASRRPTTSLERFVRGPDGEPYVARWWMGTGSMVDFTDPDSEAWWRAQAVRALRLGVEGIKADDGEGYYVGEDLRFADGTTGAQTAWRYGGLYRRSMQRALDEAHGPGRGVLFGRSGWSGQQATGVLWAGDQASDFWSLRTLVASSIAAAGSGFSNWSHDVGGYLGDRLVERCPKELLLRWVQLGAFTPLMQAHGRLEQEPWTYDRETLELYRGYVLLHEMLNPYLRAAAASAARGGPPILRPASLLDPGGWEVADAFGVGPALWVAPVVEERARERDAWLPPGEWIEAWSGARVRGGREVPAPAPLHAIPVWVRAGAIVVTHPAESVRSGLGEGDAPLHATLWGEPRCGRALARLADGTVVRWARGRWSATRRADVTFSER